MNYFAIPSHSEPKYQTLLLDIILTYIHFFINKLLVAPTVAAIEYSICSRYYSDHSNYTVEMSRNQELPCKVEPLKNRVIFLLSWYYSIDCLPGTFTRSFAKDAV